MQRSAGLLPYRRNGARLEVFLVHPGGPFWAKKDAGAWTIAKGEIGAGEEALAAARREFLEETGFAPEGEFMALPPVRQKGGKLIMAWAIAAQLDPARLASNDFSMEWPPRSGKMRDFPEVDRGAWMGLAEAREKLLASQLPLLEALEKLDL